MLKNAMLSLLVLLGWVSTAAALPQPFTVRVGDFRVSTLVEAENRGGREILIGASDEDAAAFLDADGTYATAVSTYLIRSPEGAFLVDTGFGRNLAANLKALGLSPAAVRKVLITHSHGDHIGGLLKDGRAAFPSAQVYASAQEFGWSENMRTMLEKYRGRVRTFEPGTFDAPGTGVARGIGTIAAFGHTPGHTLFLLESRGERLLIWGDLAHAMQIQMPRPDVSVTYDDNPAQAAAVRRSVLHWAAKNEVPVAGMHIPYPGIGRIVEDAEEPGGYRFIPLEGK